MFAVAVVCCALLASCDSMLDKQPQSELTPQNFYESESDAIAAVDGVYSALRLQGNYNRFHFFLTDVAADDILVRPGANPNVIALSQWTIDPNARAPRRAWEASYVGINRANGVLENVPGVEMDESLKERLIAETRVIRALLYFNLVRLFGDVPLLQEPTTSLDSLQVGRAPLADVYDLITRDLEQAGRVLPSSYEASDEGRMTSGAARGLLAKVYLTRENWGMAAENAGQVISNGEYDLVEDYKSIFSTSNEFHEESMIEVNFDGSTTGSLHTLFSITRNYPGGSAFGVTYGREELLDVFSAGDERGLEATYMLSPHTDPVRTFEWDSPRVSFNKWFDETDDQNLQSRGWQQQNNNWFVLRYADLLLMYAEAVNQGGDATAGSKFEAINEVRARAGLEPLPSSLGQAAFQDTLRLERRRELVWEGNRWFDIKRWGILEERIRETTGQTIPGDLFPIPQRELDINEELEQNPGWG